MACLSPTRPCCPVRIVSIQLLGAAGELLRVLFLDREGQLCAAPQLVPGSEAEILAWNQQIVLGQQALVQVL